MASDEINDIRKQWGELAAAYYAQVVEEGLRRLIKAKLGLEVPPSHDKTSLNAFVEGNGLTIIATPSALPSLFVLCQHGEEIGRFNVIERGLDTLECLFDEESKREKETGR
jgi:hypothetical protein